MAVNAVILAAGEGTRMKSNHAKVTHEMLGLPLVSWAVRAAREAGCERIIVVVGHGADEVRSVLAGELAAAPEDGSAASPIEFVEQTERLGTGHAVRCVRDAIGGFSGPVVVTYGDTPNLTPETIRALVAENRAHHNACTVLTMCPPDPTGYGRVARDASGAVEAIIEHKDCTPEQREQLRECNSGVYCFCGRRLTENLDRLTNDNAQSEYYLTDMVAIYRELGEPVAALCADDYTELLGVNSRSQLAEATRVAQRRINERLMTEGVTMLDPALVWAGPDVTVGRDTTILPMTFLSGDTHVGEACTLGPNTRLTDTRVGDGCVVDETVAIEATLEDDVTCGPRAYLRPGTHMLDGSKAGTHVEIKKSTIGEGSKVPHLSYIGDTTMGSGVNVGAGSITCNYDGVHKHKTVIGDDVFIGSDTMLVAPAEVGDGALVAAGSVITSPVPADALGVGRARQRNIDGWAPRHRAQLEKE